MLSACIIKLISNLTRQVLQHELDYIRGALGLNDVLSLVATLQAPREVTLRQENQRIE